jgi:hypothetical protein
MREPLVFLYAAVLAFAGVLTITGLHSDVSRLFARLFPEPVAAALPGVMNIAWYDIGYAIGRSLNAVSLFNTLPPIGGAASLLSAFVLIKKSSWSKRVVLGNLWLILTLTLLAIILPLLTGGMSSWRLVTFAASLLTNGVVLALLVNRKLL